MKNILQSLKGITSIIESASQPENFGDTQKVLQGQFPYLGQRLQRILDKIQQPLQSQQTYVLIREWWTNLQARYHKREIIFSANMMWNSKIPEEIFDNVVENLLENAFNKRQREPDLHIQVTLETTEKQVRLIVCDNGTVIPEELFKQLLTQPVPSRDGYGVGLYQVAKQTIHSGYRLKVSHNEKGKVCFELVSV
jgi:C4-dicarboxylate-specific signal transduction histidine kinase